MRIGLVSISRLASWLVLFLAFIGLAKASIVLGTDLHVHDQQNVVGSWTEPAPIGTHAIHSIYLVTGKILLWNRAGDTYLFDPETGISVKSSEPPFNIFCAGHVILPDGRVFIAGGHIDNYYGLANAAIYNPFTDTWKLLPSMSYKRWYPSCELLPSGNEVFVLSGQITPQLGTALYPEIYNLATNTWRQVGTPRAEALYPMIYLNSSGYIFDIGPLTKTKRYKNVLLPTASLGSITANPGSAFRGQGSSAMYLPGKVILAGGGDPPTARTDIIDVDAASPTWTQVQSMSVPRRQCNLTILPTGMVLATG